MSYSSLCLFLINEEHKVWISLNSQQLTSDVMDEINIILQDQFPKINGHQPTVYAPVFDDIIDQWTWNVAFQAVEPPSVQILHNGKGHWVATLQPTVGPVYLLDSLYGPHTSPSLQIQIAQIYNRSKLQTIPIIISKIHKQTNSVDCVVLAIANIVEFCFTGYLGNLLVQFDVDKIRPHLAQCLINKKLTPFPKVSKSNRKRKPDIYLEQSLNVHCCCFMPECTGNMIQCDKKKCKKWYFRKCISNVSISKKWYCGYC